MTSIELLIKANQESAEQHRIAYGKLLAIKFGKMVADRWGIMTIDEEEIEKFFNDTQKQPKND